MVEHKSALVRKIEASPRWTKTVDLASVLRTYIENHDGTAITRAVVRINTKTEDIRAIRAAYEALDNEATKVRSGKDDFKADKDVLTDLKSINALYEAFRDPDNPLMPLFVTPQWMSDNLSTTTLDGLLNAYLTCSAEAAGQPVTADDYPLEELRQAIMLGWDTELPEAVLLPYGREHLAHMVALVMHAWTNDRRMMLDAIVAGGDELLKLKELWQDT